MMALLLWATLVISHYCLSPVRWLRKQIDSILYECLQKKKKSFAHGEQNAVLWFNHLNKNGSNQQSLVKLIQRLALKSVQI